VVERDRAFTEVGEPSRIVTVVLPVPADDTATEVKP
jgi:hypothetical protein